jgi:hypothetical protein
LSIRIANYFVISNKSSLTSEEQALNAEYGVAGGDGQFCASGLEMRRVAHGSAHRDVVRDLSSPISLAVASQLTLCFTTSSYAIF